MLAQRVGVVVNPTSAGGHGAAFGRRFAAAARLGGHEVVPLSGDSYDSAAHQAGEAVRSGSIDALAVVGGDGMAHLGVQACARSPIPLLIVAAGTGNDNARTLGLPIHAPERSALLLSADDGMVEAVDVGHASTEQGERHWLGVLGAGFDSVVNERASKWQRVPGRMRYPLATVRELVTFRPIPYRITVDDTVIDTSAMLVAVGNGPSFGGGMRVCPDASMTDGLLDVMVLHSLPKAAFLKMFPTVYSGRHVTHPQVQVLRGREVLLEADSIIAQGDGERVGRLPLTARALPAALRLVVPAAGRGPNALGGAAT